MAEPFDPYRIWLAISVKDQPPNHYRLLGLDLFEPDASTIENAADQRMTHLRVYQTGNHSDLSQKLLNEVAAARVCLLNPKKKTEYDAKLRRELEAAGAEASEELDADLMPALAETKRGEAKPTLPTEASGKRTSVRLILGAAAGGAALLLVLVIWMITSRGAPKPVAQVGAKEEPAPAEIAATADAEPAATAIPNSPPVEPTVQASAGQPTADAELSPKPTVASPTPKDQSKAQEPAAVPQPATPAQPTTAATVPASGAQAPNSTGQSSTPSSLASSPGLQASFAKNPVPDNAALAPALKLAQEMYKEEYDKADTPQALTDLARKILGKAGEIQGEAVGHFVFLRLARDVATKAEDADTAFEAIDRLGEAFEVNPWEMKGAILSDWSKRARKPAEHKACAERTLALMKEALEHDAVTVAEQMARLAVAEASKARDEETAQQARAGRKQVQQARKALAPVEAALTSLRERPEDPEAHLVMGRYWCFRKDDWQQGLRHLAQGSDATLKALAQKDLAAVAAQLGSTVPGLAGQAAAEVRPPSSSPVAVGDGWWDLAQGAEGKERERMMSRAGYWYQRGTAEVEDPLRRIKIEKRLEEISKLVLPPPEVPAAEGKPSGKGHRRKTTDRPPES